MNSNEQWVRIRFQDGRKLECTRAQLFSADVQSVLSLYHRQIADCLCGVGKTVQIVHEPSERRFITRAKPNEQELHPHSCGAVTRIRGIDRSTQAGDFGYRAERAFDETYFVQCQGEADGLGGFCTRLVASLGRKDFPPIPEKKFVAGVCENEDEFLSFASHAPCVAMLQLAVWKTSDGKFLNSQMPVKMGTPVGGRLESFGHPIRGLFLWVAEVDGKAATVEALHVWPIVVTGGFVHSVHSESERTLARHFHQLGFSFVKPPSQLFLKDYGASVNLPQPEQLIRYNTWPDFFVCINSRWCVVELGGIRDWTYLIQKLKKRRIYSELHTQAPDFSWIMLVPAEHEEFRVEFGSEKTPLDSHFKMLPTKKLSSPV